MPSTQPIAPDKKLAAICGLFCPSCSLFIASTQDPARLRAISERFGIAPEELECRGCRSDKRGFYCREHCKMTECAAERGLDFCGACPEFPCADLKAFQAQMPHRLELWDSQRRITEVGYEQWYLEMLEHNRTPASRMEGDVSVWVGTPDQIAETIQGYRQVGFHTFIAELAAPYDAETMESLIGIVRPMVEAHPVNA